jgi:hypothetical protein
MNTEPEIATVSQASLKAWGIAHREQALELLAKETAFLEAAKPLIGEMPKTVEHRAAVLQLLLGVALFDYDQPQPEKQ